MTKITNQQMSNVIIKDLLSTKGDSKRTLNNIQWYIQERGKGKATEELLKKAIEFELQRFYHYENGETYVFTINEDYTSNYYQCDDLNKAIDIVHSILMKTKVYSSLLG